MRRLGLALVLLLVAAPAASGGGARTDIAAGGGAIWAVGDFGLRAVDARDGRIVYAPRPRAARYDVGIAIVGGAAFVAGVANGDTHGDVTRIDLRTHETRVVWQRADTSVQYVTAGVGDVYALLGARSGSSVIRLSAAGKVDGTWRIVDAGRIAADASGCWVAADHRLLHIRTNGTVVEVLQSEGLEDVATGGGAAWFMSVHTLTRVDERTGVIRTLRVPGLAPLGANHELAVGAGFLWTITSDGLQRRNLRTGRVEHSAALPTADALTVAGGAVWVATGSDELYRLDPRTLHATLHVALV